MMKKIKSSVLSTGNDNFVKVEIKGNRDKMLYAFYINGKSIAIGFLSEIKAMYDSWFNASEEQRDFALNNNSIIGVKK